ncbi:MAG: hypothetical protein FJX63_06080, partial [Alphaproteobacteria bacterium]|nr:hypothetical protein [Alphaproteobacteria bacterium]
PRSRNAQVALYQSGDVDYIVATDAIGMGLNMDVDHVAFAATRKFDGFQFRNLNPGELAQVAGRAGRYLNDGTFGVTGEADPFDNETVERLESHRFDAVQTLQWRNRDLDFASLDRLRRSLSTLPSSMGLTRAQAGPDILALEAISRDEDVAALATQAGDVAKLWDVCQIPDYRNISAAEHAGLVARIFRFLQTGRGYIDEDWFARMLAHCDRAEGDLDTLSNRISHVRTWTFITHRANWLEAPLYWQARAREIEDRLSDALHERLTQRFIDRRASVLMRRLAQKEELMSTVEEDGAIRVEGEYVGRISGFCFIPDGATDGAEARTLKAAALQAVATEIEARAKAVAMSADPDLKLTRTGEIVWNHATVGRAEAGPSPLKPRADVVAGDQLTGPAREEVQARLQKFLDRHVAATLEPLIKLEEAEGLDGLARGIAFRLVETFGVLPREQVAEEVKSLSQDDRGKLRAHGVRFGAFHLFVPALLKPAATELRLLLWGLQLAREGRFELANLPLPPGQGLTSAIFDRSTPRGFYGVCGYRICGNRVVRIDMLERLADLIRERVFWRPRIPEEQRPAGSVEGGGFAIIPDMMSLVGCSGEEFEGILRSLDFRLQKRKVKRPAAAVPDAPVTVQSTSDPAAPVEGAAPDAVAGEVAATAEASAEIVVTEEQPPVTEPVASDANPPPDQAATDDLVEIEVWWPKDTGPFRRRTEKKEARPPRRDGGRRNQQKAEPEAGAGSDKPERARTEKQAPRREERRRPEKPPDPNSPFAVLGALKEKLNAKSN